MSEGFVEATQQTLGSIIKKPPLSTKLLEKPPFRFLHDVIVAVVRNTEFFDGLYTDDELNSNNIKDRDAKINFLQKSIDAIQFVSGQPLSVKAAKTVAGHEPEKTNEFLQAIGIALQQKTDSKDAVEKVLAGEKPNFASSAGSNKENKESSKHRSSSEKKSTSKEKPEKSKTSSKDKEKSSTSEKDKRKRDSSKDVDKSKDRSSKSKSDKAEAKPSKEKSGDSLKNVSSRDKSKSRKDSEKTEKPSRSRRDSVTKERPSTSSKHKSSKKHKTEDQDDGPTMNGHVNDNDEDDIIMTNHDNSSSQSDMRRLNAKSAVESTRHAPDADAEDSPLLNRLQRQAHSAVPRPGTALGRPGTAGGRPGTAMQRPGTAARRAPVRIKRTDVVPEPEHANRIDSAKVASANLIVETGDGEMDEDNFIEDSAEPSDFDIVMGKAQEMGEDADDLNEEDHGKLVGTILRTKKELEATVDAQNKLGDKGLVAFDEKERQKTKKEAQKIQEQIQQLTRTAHPLGKMTDYLQEDVDSMLKELEQWRLETRENMIKLKQKQGEDDSSVGSLRVKLREFDDQIREQQDIISTTKSNILGNREKISQFMQQVTKK